MKIIFKNLGSGEVRLYYDRSAAIGSGVDLAPQMEAVVSLRDDDEPVSIHIIDGAVAIWNERATVSVEPAPDPSKANHPYDEYGRLIDAAEAQQQVMLGLFDIGCEAADAAFSGELMEEFRRVRLKFVDEFEAKYPGYGRGRAVWR